MLSLFLNLIDNARKASEPGGRIWLLGDRLQDGYHITVQDEGRGIEPEKLARITEKTDEKAETVENDPGI